MVSSHTQSRGSAVPASHPSLRGQDGSTNGLETTHGSFTPNPAAIGSCVCERQTERMTSWLSKSEDHESPPNSAAKKRQKLLAGREQGVSLGGVMSSGFISTGSNVARAVMNSEVASGSAGLGGSPGAPSLWPVLTGRDDLQHQLEDSMEAEALSHAL